MVHRLAILVFGLGVVSGAGTAWAETARPRLVVLAEEAGDAALAARLYERLGALAGYQLLDADLWREAGYSAAAQLRVLEAEPGTLPDALVQLVQALRAAYRLAPAERRERLVTLAAAFGADRVLLLEAAGAGTAALRCAPLTPAPAPAGAPMTFGAAADDTQQARLAGLVARCGETLLAQPPPPEAGAAGVPTAPLPGAPEKPLYKKWWFWTAIGVAVLTSSVILGVGLSSDDDRLTLQVVR